MWNAAMGYPMSGDGWGPGLESWDVSRAERSGPVATRGLLQRKTSPLGANGRCAPRSWLNINRKMVEKQPPNG